MDKFECLLKILDDRIDLHEMLYRKRRHASQTGNIYIPVDRILG